MKIATIVMVHKEPAQVARLLARLVHPQNDIFLHVDQKCPLEDFTDLIETSIQLIKPRHNLKWAGLSQVTAMLACMRQVMAAPVQYDYLHFLSGQDYPIRPLGEWVDFLARHLGQQFMQYELMGEPGWWPQALHRVEQYHLADQQFPGRHRLAWLITKLLPKRKFPLSGYVLAGRSSWSTLTRPAVEYVLRFVDQHPEVVRFFGWCWGPDEIFFPTILHNSPFRESIVRDNNLRYIDWSEQKASPKTLTLADFGTMMASGCFFARKFDPGTDAQVMDELDRVIS
jgi:Core-2/I-Branching enzyme